MEGILEYKVGAADLPGRPLAIKLLYVAIGVILLFGRPQKTAS